MRILCLFLFWFLITTSYALKVIATENPKIDATPYLEENKTLPEKQEEFTDLEEYPLPVTSRMQAGVVKRHTLKQNAFSQALFVVGDDAISRDWLKANALKLQKNNALGFVTNVKTAKALHELIKLAGLPLAPVDADELSVLFNVNHYPFAYDAGVVWQ